MDSLVIAVASFMVFLLKSPDSQGQGFFFFKIIFKSVAQSYHRCATLCATDQEINHGNQIQIKVSDHSGDTG
jgi:hypothetical protein